MYGLTICQNWSSVVWLVCPDKVKAGFIYTLSRVMKTSRMTSG